MAMTRERAPIRVQTRVGQRNNRVFLGTQNRPVKGGFCYSSRMRALAIIVVAALFAGAGYYIATHRAEVHVQTSQPEAPRAVSAKAVNEKTSVYTISVKYPHVGD